MFLLFLFRFFFHVKCSFVPSTLGYFTCYIYVVLSAMHCFLCTPRSSWCQTCTHLPRTGAKCHRGRRLASPSSYRLYESRTPSIVTTPSSQNEGGGRRREGEGTKVVPISEANPQKGGGYTGGSIFGPRLNGTCVPPPPPPPSPTSPIPVPRRPHWDSRGQNQNRHKNVSNGKAGSVWWCASTSASC